MIYDNLIINKEVNKKILSFYLNDHLPNAFIFYGNDGIGKEAHALEFFAFMNCKYPDSNKACGNCSSCKKTKLLQHELLNIIIPLPKNRQARKNDPALSFLSDKDRNELINQFIEKGKDPYFKIKMNGANTIILNSIKDIKNNINLSISDNSVKVHLILEAEKLCYPNKESANALLKILEEPKKNNLFILVTSDINKIIDTILSRCTTLFFSDIEIEIIKNNLLNKNITEEKAEMISKLCFGNIREAFNLIKSFDTKIKSIKDITTALFNKDLNKWQLTFNNMNKEEILNIFNLLMLYFRDLKTYNKSEHICFNGFKNEYQRLLTNYPHSIWSHCINTINNSCDYLLRNGHPKLVITSLFIEISNILKNEYYDEFKLNEWVMQQ